MEECTIYIDEAGDLGINRGTNWFVLAGIIIKKADENSIKTVLAGIKTKLNLRTIHFRELRDFMKQAYVAKAVTACRFTTFAVVIDTSKITMHDCTEGQNISCLTYNYAVKLLLQRISPFLVANNLNANIVLSSRGTSRDGELIAYIKDKLLNYPYNNITGNHFLKISAIPAPSWEMLQIADICATAMFYSLEPKPGYGLIVPCFQYCLKPHLAQKPDGIIWYAKSMKIPKNYFDNKMFCNRIGNQ